LKIAELPAAEKPSWLKYLDSKHDVFTEIQPKRVF